MPKDWSNANELWADVLVETLRCKGVDYAITCPGSRSSPLTFAFARNEGIEAIPILDERSAGFFALGLAKRTGKPVALVCTSGSAVANFFPAVVEASESGIPLVLLTADRPSELRDCAAGQAIDQVKFFGGYVRKQFELAVPDAALLLLRYLRQTVSHAINLAMAADRGPVQLNIPFRDPLIPIAVEGFASPFDAESYAAFFAELSPSDVLPFLQAQLPKKLEAVEKGLILVGPCSPVNEDAWCENVGRLANDLGWPVLADALNPVRTNSRAFESVVSGYEFVLRNPSLKVELAPEHVIVVGSFPTSKALREWIGEYDVPVTILSDRPANVDATHSRSSQVYADFEFGGVIAGLGNAEAYRDRWMGLELDVLEELDRRFEAMDEFFEGKVSWMLSRSLPEWSALCVSNSMPPRDMEFYFGKRETPVSLYSSRGANGIDGILSTAMGVAHEGEPTFLLTGDLALLHDTNGALVGKDLIGSLTIVLVNNAGGGIFEMLPVSKFEDVFEKHYGTDQQIDFSNWSKTYGISYQRIESWEDLVDCLEEPGDGVRLVEIIANRREDAATRKRWFAEIGELLV